MRMFWVYVFAILQIRQVLRQRCQENHSIMSMVLIVIVCMDMPQGILVICQRSIMKISTRSAASGTNESAHFVYNYRMYHATCLFRIVLCRAC